MFQQLLLQLTFIVFPMLIYFTIVRISTNLKKYKTIIFGILCGLSIILCMTFPFSFVTGNIMDLRSIPWMIAFLYGGFPMGIVLTASMLLYRIIIGGAGMYIVIIAYSVSLIPIWLFFKNYLQFNSLSNKFKSSIYLILFNSLFIVIGTQFTFSFPFDEMYLFYLFFLLMHVIMTIIIIYLIETFRENEQLQIELQKAEKLNIVGQMAASVAHEIRNPMTVVKGFLQLLNEDKDTPEKHKGHFKIMQLEIDRAEAIINDYLTLAKPQAEKLEAVDLKKQISVIKDTLANYAFLKGVHLVYEVPSEEDFFIIGGKEKVKQVLINIVKNAIEVSEKNDPVFISLSKKSEQIIIKIIDNGVGLSEEQIKNLGIPFYSTKENGTGLGLTVCYNIVHAMNGTIDVTSKKNAGTTFEISIPEYKN